MELRSNQFFFAPARLLRGNTRNNSRPDKDVGQPAALYGFYQAEKDLSVRRRDHHGGAEEVHGEKEQMKMEARAAGLLEECVICLAPYCLSLDMIS